MDAKKHLLPQVLFMFCAMVFGVRRKAVEIHLTYILQQLLMVGAKHFGCDEMLSRLDPTKRKSAIALQHL